MALAPSQTLDVRIEIPGDISPGVYNDYLTIETTNNTPSTLSVGAQAYVI
jgi:hypothetical protein